jgi:hypothetical protein
MAGFFQQYLEGAVGLNQPYLRDPQHASKTFRTNGFGNAPKLKFLFHVYFEINDTLVASNPAAFPDKILPGLLVKNISLPKYSMQLSELNQYNRTRYVQTKIKYDPVQIAFHDDSLGAIKKIWHNYYSYYYNDTTTARLNPYQVNKKYMYKEDISPEANWGYLGEPTTSAQAASVGQSKPAFFKSIQIYGFNQHSFSAYTLINPIIERFDHDTYDYSQATGTMENKMTVRYEAVTYQEGAINGTNPGAKVPGFGSETYYDRELSPLATAGSIKSIMGQGGLVDALDGIIADVGSNNYLGAVQKAVAVSKTFKNTDAVVDAVKREVKNAAFSALANPSQFSLPSFGSGDNKASTSGTSNTQAPEVNENGF